MYLTRLKYIMLLENVIYDLNILFIIIFIIFGFEILCAAVCVIVDTLCGCWVGAEEKSETAQMVSR